MKRGIPFTRTFCILTMLEDVLCTQLILLASQLVCADQVSDFSGQFVDHVLTSIPRTIVLLARLSLTLPKVANLVAK